MVSRRRLVSIRHRLAASGPSGGAWLGWLAVAGIGLAVFAAAVRWGTVVFSVLMVAGAAITGACTGFWLAAEWTNMDDREMAGEHFPVLAVATSTCAGAIVLGGPMLLIVLLAG